MGQVGRPRLNKSASELELDKAEEQLDRFEENVKQMTMDSMNAAPKEEVENQTKLSSQEMKNSKEIYLKPIRSISCRDKFNEAYREAYEYDRQYVRFIAENREIIGEAIELWTRPYGGMPAEEWKVPVNKPVWGPRYLAEQIKRKYYHRMKMEDKPVGGDNTAQYYGVMAVDTTVQRLDAYPAKDNARVFMGSKNF